MFSPALTRGGRGIRNGTGNTRDHTRGGNTRHSVWEVDRVCVTKLDRVALWVATTTRLTVKVTVVDDAAGVTRSACTPIQEYALKNWMGVVLDEV